MGGIHRSLEYILMLPNGQYFGRFNKDDKNAFLTGCFDNENGAVKTPTLKVKKKKNTNIDHKKILNEFLAQQRTKGIDTFFLSQDESKKIIVFSGILNTGGASTDKCRLVFKSDGKTIVAKMKCDPARTVGLANAEITLEDKPRTKYSFQLDAKYIRFLRNDELSVRIGKNGLITFSSAKYEEDVHIQST